MKDESGSDVGHIYVLSSPNCTSLKIGRTTQLAPLRLAQINTSQVYKEYGPWSIVEVVQVENVKAVETRIHRSIRSRFNSAIPGQNELFEISIAEARNLIRDKLTRGELIGYPKLKRCFFDPSLATYLERLYGFSGLDKFLDDQGAWTLSLFTSTAGGRYFTLNIGSHEVAFSSQPKRGESTHFNFLMVDRLILDYPEVRKWARKHNGNVAGVHYETQRDRAVGIDFYGDFSTSLECLTLPGVRRSLIAYWTEGLLEMRGTGRESSYKQSHQWNAVVELQRRIDGLPPLITLGQSADAVERNDVRPQRC